MSLEKRLSSLYFDPINSSAFASEKNLYQGVKEKKWNDISRHDVKKFLHKTRVYTLHKQYKKGKTGPIFSWGINYLWEIDLVDVQSLSYQNRGIRYLLCIIDSFSKFLRVVPIRRKLAANVSKALQDVFNEGEVPICIGSDLGGEFWGELTQNIMKNNNINHYAMTGKNKAANCERVIQTLKNRIYRFLTHNRTKSFIDSLDNIVTGINATKHSSTKLAPDKVNYNNQGMVFENLYGAWYEQLGKPLRLLFKKNDKVRLAEPLLMFRKGYKPKFSEKIYVVQNVVFSNVPRYTIMDPETEELIGSFFAFDLVKVEEQEEEESS